MLLLLWTDAATGENVVEGLISEGLVTVRQEARNSPELARLQELEQAARAAGKGRWAASGHADHVRDIKWSVDNPRQFVEKARGKPIPAVVEHVRDGSTMRLFLLPDFHHITLMVSGVRVSLFSFLFTFDDHVLPIFTRFKFANCVSSYPVLSYLTLGPMLNKCSKNINWFYHILVTLTLCYRILLPEDTWLDPISATLIGWLVGWQRCFAFAEPGLQVGRRGQTGRFGDGAAGRGGQVLHRVAPAEPRRQRLPRGGQQQQLCRQRRPPGKQNKTNLRSSS